MFKRAINTLLDEHILESYRLPVDAIRTDKRKAIRCYAGSIASHAVFLISGYLFFVCLLDTFSKGFGLVPSDFSSFGLLAQRGEPFRMALANQLSAAFCTLLLPPHRYAYDAWNSLFHGGSVKVCENPWPPLNQQTFIAQKKRGGWFRHHLNQHS